MTFWVGVAVVYAIVLSLGLTLGRYLAERFPGRDQGGGRQDPQPAPVPPGPSYALEFPALGSAFDRALLPGAFDEAAISEPAA
ncbi:MAG: hypothetical protein QOI02_750 [Actinomycetota bacterium]|nr:hypothetical protein [Actinomycetota bacterium]